MKNWKTSAESILTTGRCTGYRGKKTGTRGADGKSVGCWWGARSGSDSAYRVCAVDAIRAIAKEVPEAIVGVGTVLNPQQLAEVTEAGAQFAISPGLTERAAESCYRRDYSSDSGDQHCFRTDAGYGLRFERVQILPG